jgi:uncharacterized protein YjbJ (UPF0337 family)
MGILDDVRGAAGGIARANLGLLDKATGRVRRIAGDALGSDRMRRQGREEERKGEIKEELAEREADLDATREDAERRKQAELDRAATAARRQFQQAEQRIRAEDTRVEIKREEANRKARAVRSVENATEPGTLAKRSTRSELEKQARDLGISGVTGMSKQELAGEIVARR